MSVTLDAGRKLDGAEVHSGWSCIEQPMGSHAVSCPGSQAPLLLLYKLQHVSLKPASHPYEAT